jgi:cytochrome oxidase Cu insertion factor (SCO1/SenC/PrrC family)
MEYKRPGVADGWHFLTGDAASIKRLTDAAGFRYVYDEGTKQFAHASAIYVATPEGKLALSLRHLVSAQANAFQFDRSRCGQNRIAD